MALSSVGYPIESGTEQRTDLVGGIHRPYMKLMDPTVGSDQPEVPRQSLLVELQSILALLTDGISADIAGSVTVAPADLGPTTPLPVRISNSFEFLDGAQSGPATVNALSSGNTTAVAAPAAGFQLVIFRGTLHNANPSQIIAGLRAGTGGVNLFQAPLAADGGGTPFDFGTGWILPEATALVVNLAAAGNVHVNVTHFRVKAVPA